MDPRPDKSIQGRDTNLPVEIMVDCDIGYIFDDGDAENGQGPTVAIKYILLPDDDGNPSRNITDLVSDSERDRIECAILANELEGRYPE